MEMLRRIFRGVPLFVERASSYDIIDRLKLDVSGPPIHIDYYRQDAADALAEIQRLRQTLAAFIKQ